ncbi:MAG: S41 family peptidase [Bacteroidaceae bacterium]|nr:S41 family peptidase [Bacteroidaceae bacterium]
MKTIKYLLLTCCSLLMLASCQEAEQQDNTPQGNLDALWNIIDQHYCFLDYKAETIGLDWNRVHQQYRARLNNSMTSTQLFEVMAAMLSELRDGHVNLYTSMDMARNWSWREDYPTNYDYELQESYLGSGTDYRISSGLKYRILDDNVGYVVISTFNTSIGEGNLDEAMHYLRACNGLIVDVRSNGGGDLTVAERVAQRFTNERRLVGYICHKTGKGHNDFSTPQAEYLEPSTGVRWQKRAIVLTNRGCYSATNTFVRDMKACPLVTIMGDQTGGGSGLPFSSELPNGWSVRFSACPSFDASMQHTEFGIQPHIPCALKAEDAAKGVDTIIEQARALLK